MEIRKNRLEEKSESLDILELEWWERNAILIEKIWMFEGFLSRAVRKNYMKKAEKFLLGSSKKVHVLELGCGSGWVGQFLASEKISIDGTDFSPKQIQLAKENAIQIKKNDYLSYHVGDSTNSTIDINKYTGVLIHAFIHHLDEPEMLKLFENVFSKLESGIKIWIYEPAHVSAKQRKGLPSKKSKKKKYILVMANLIISFVMNITRALRLQDTKLSEEFQKETQLAQSNGWYFSPKEIPLELSDFYQTLSRYEVDVKSSYWATGFIIGWANSVALLKFKPLRWFMTQVLIRPLSFLDTKLISDTEFIDSAMQPPAYAFRVWECVKN